VGCMKFLTNQFVENYMSILHVNLFIYFFDMSPQEGE
jgi:hypothetical protein